MINEDKIISYLHNDLKLALYEVNESHYIIVKSPIANLRRLIDFVESLNYYLSYNVNSIYIIPKS